MNTESPSGETAPADEQGGVSPTRRRLLVGGVIALIFAAAVTGAVVLGGDDGGSVSEATTGAEGATRTDPDSTGSSDTAHADDESAETEPDSSPPDLTSPDVSTPGAGSPSEGSESGSGVGDSETGLVFPELPTLGAAEPDTCASVKDGLIEYRKLALAASAAELGELQFGLEEYENVSDFVGEGHDWGLLIVEQLVLVQRDWSTASTAELEGDPALAVERRESALEYLDAAIAVQCPE